MVALVSSPVESIALSLIDESPLNPRRHWHALDELAASLKREQLEPLIVRPHPTVAGRFELADGARRFRAAKSVALPTLFAKVCLLNDAEMYAIILGKGVGGNVDPLTPFEEALAYEEAMKRLQLNLEGIANCFSRDRTRVARCLALLHLPEEAKRAIEKGDLPFTTAAELARIPGEQIRAKTVKAVLHSDVHGGVMPYRAAKQYIDTQVCRSLGTAPFKVDDALLLPDAGACAKCRFRAGNDKVTYGDVKNPNTCMNPTCYEQKEQAARARVLQAEAKDGKVQLTAEENAEAFLPGEKTLNFKSPYVPWKQPPTRDLLKPDVSSVPAWSDLCEGEKQVTVYVGVNQAGHPVDLVKLSEALLAVPKSELAIFSESVMRRHLIERKKQEGTPLPKAPDRKKARADAPVAAAGSQPSEGKETEAERESEAPDAWQDRAAAWIAAALEAAPTLPPHLRENGFHLLREVGASTLTHHAEQSGEATQSAPQSAGDLAALRDEACRLFCDASLLTKEVRDRVTRVACGGVDFESLTSEAQLNALLRMLRNRAAPPREAAAAGGAGE